MTILKGEHIVSLWICTVFFTSLHFWGGAASSATEPALPTPVLKVVSRSGDVVVIVCEAPVGQRAVQFTLYHAKEQVDTVVDQQGTTEAQFTVSVKEGDSAQQNLYCCLYKNNLGFYSAFSPYFNVDQLPAPTLSPASFPSPVLTVEPASGRVKRGQVLSFRCVLPAAQSMSGSQSQSQAQQNPKPVVYLLLKTVGWTGATSVVLQPQDSRLPDSTAQPGAFTVGPVKGGEGGSYTCLYQFPTRRAVLNSTASNAVQVTITDLLPLPTLTLQQQQGGWHLLCTGSPAYPGALFTLYHADNKYPVATQRAGISLHHAVFPVPVQDRPSAHYQCQHSALLGKEWSSSERSLPLAVSKGISTPASPGASSVDWPLIVGSFSAAVLFIAAVVLVVALLLHKKVRAAAAERKRREEAEFWSRGHSKDHVPEHPDSPRCSSNSQNWAHASMTSELASRSSLWNPLSTFTPQSFH